MIKTLDRISHILRSNVNEVLDRLEDPEKMVRQMVRDMEAAVDRAVGAVSTAVADQRRLAKEKAATRERIENMHAKATRALERGDEALARQALARKVVLEETLAGIERVSAADVQRVATDLFGSGSLGATVLAAPGLPAMSSSKLHVD